MNLLFFYFGLVLRCFKKGTFHFLGEMKAVQFCAGKSGHDLQPSTF